MGLQTSTFGITHLVRYRHLEITADNSWPKQVLEGMPPGRKKQGRPRIEWMDE
jgi:hypothetical protein